MKYAVEDGGKILCGFKDGFVLDDPVLDSGVYVMITIFGYFSQF
jgi:hypothetical protein